MFDFNTLAELFKHIQVNIKTPSYLNNRNNGEWESMRNMLLIMYENRIETTVRIDVMRYVMSNTDKIDKKEYDGNRLNNRRLRGGGL